MPFVVVRIILSTSLHGRLKDFRQFTTAIFRVYYHFPVDIFCQIIQGNLAILAYGVPISSALQVSQELEASLSLEQGTWWVV